MKIDHRTQEFDRVSGGCRERGFSLVELMMVCIILTIIAMLAIPNISRIVNNYKLDAAGHSVASLLQQARMQAVKTNLPVYANMTNGTPTMAFFATDPNAAYTVGSPEVALSTSITFQPPATGAGFHSQLDTYLGGGTPVINQTVGFNARGLPCVGGANPTVCTATSAGSEWFLQSATGWEAITVTPAGRVKSWRLSGQSGSSYSWQ
jgi:prepilin-type N-terminal cleavage/methylation domain-containing protein